MAVVRGFMKQLRALFRKGEVEQEMGEELAFHLEMQTAQNIAAGMTPRAARRAALVAFGGVERYGEQVRQARWISGVEDVLADVRYSLRMVARRPGFAAAVIVTLGLGIGGTTAIFSVVDGLFLRGPGGTEDSESLRRLYVRRDEGNITTPEGGAGSYLDYQALAQSPGFSGVAGYMAREVDLGRGPEADQVKSVLVTPDYFEVLGVRPALGRFFTAEEHGVAGRHPVAVVSHGFWRDRLGGSRGALGSTITVNSEQLEVIGVTERSFAGTDAEADAIWVPAAMAKPLGLMGSKDDWRTLPGSSVMALIGRLREDVTEETALADGAAALQRAAEGDEAMDPTPEVLAARLTAATGPYSPQPVKAADLSLWLAGIAALVLLIACANVANLLLARAVTRRRETALRLSLGAGRWRLTRQHLTEAVVLALLGGAAGLLITYWGVRLIRQFPLPPSAGQVDLRLLAFVATLSVVTGLVFGVLPALRAVNVDPQQGLRDTRSGPGISRSRTRRALVAVQVALSLTLLIGAGLFVRSLSEIYSIDSGVDMAQLSVVGVDLARASFSEPEREEFYRVAQARLAALPGVERTGMVHFTPFGGMGYGARLAMPGREIPKFESGPYLNLAGPGYFATAGLQLLAGRDFTAADATGEPTLIVNDRFARALSPNPGDVLGLCVPIGAQVKEGGCSRIVGIVESQRHTLLDENRPPMLYLPRERDPGLIARGGPFLIVRTAGGAEDHTAAVREALQALRSDLPFISVQPMEELVQRQVLPFKLGATLFSLFGVLALALAAIGLYGVLGYFVAERTHEIGIRRSLGSPLAGVIALVVRQGLMPVLGGLAAGFALALFGSQFLGALLHGVQPRDPLAFMTAGAFMLLVATLATAIPARRAARVDPAVALRQD